MVFKHLWGQRPRGSSQGSRGADADPDLKAQHGAVRSGAGSAPQGCGHSPELREQCTLFGSCSVGPGVGLHDPSGSPPNWDAQDFSPIHWSSLAPVLVATRSKSSAAEESRAVISEHDD